MEEPSWAIATIPLQSTGCELSTGQHWNRVRLAVQLRNATENMHFLIRSAADDSQRTFIQATAAKKNFPIR
jgi:hypothetical protein